MKSGSSKYQVFNEQKKKLKIGDEVTVYGEYYGFLKGTLIESEENHDSATIRQNPFETYEEVAEGFEDLLAPLELFLIESIKVIWI